MKLYIEKRNFKYLMAESYLAFVKNSVGTKAYRNFYAIDERGKKVDVLKNGEISCAIFVSTVLWRFKLIKKLHFTVRRTVEDILASGHKKTAAKLQPGDVLVWEENDNKDWPHPHIGFYVGNNQAISNSEKKGIVVKHHYTFNGRRKILFAVRPRWN